MTADSTMAAPGSVVPPLAICIPALNEAEELPGLFLALEALTPVGTGDVHICLLLDNCTDGSAGLAAAYRQRSRHRVTVAACRSHSNAGSARGRAMRMGLDALAGSAGYLLTTDADSAPAPDWLATMGTALGIADVVTGRIVRRGAAPSRLQERIEAYYDRLFALRRRLDPVAWEAASTHHQTGGANLGVRGDVYRAMGGFLPIANGEDARFIDDAARAGWRTRRDAACLVRTSDRRIGRAALGLASALRHLDQADIRTIQVARPSDVAWQYAMHAEARAGFEGQALERIAKTLGLTHDHAIGVARDSVNAEAFAMCIVPAPPGGMRTLALPVAEAELDRLVAARRAA